MHTAAETRRIAEETHAVIAPAVNAVLQPWRAPDSVVLALADAIDGGSSGGGGSGEPSPLNEPERAAVVRTLEDSLGHAIAAYAVQRETGKDVRTVLATALRAKEAAPLEGFTLTGVSLSFLLRLRVRAAEKRAAAGPPSDIGLREGRGRGGHPHQSLRARTAHRAEPHLHRRRREARRRPLGGVACTVLKIDRSTARFAL